MPADACRHREHPPVLLTVASAFPHEVCPYPDCLNMCTSLVLTQVHQHQILHVHVGAVCSLSIARQADSILPAQSPKRFVEVKGTPLGFTSPGFDLTLTAATSRCVLGQARRVSNASGPQPRRDALPWRPCIT